MDTCYAGQGAVDAVRALAAQLVAARDADPRTLTAFSVIAAARPLELAEDGAFARALRTALDDPTLGGNRQPKLYLEQVVDRVNEFLGPFQHATWGTLPSGEGFDFLPNPRYSPDVPHEGTDLAEQRTALTRTRPSPFTTRTPTAWPAEAGRGRMSAGDLPGPVCWRSYQ